MSNIDVKSKAKLVENEATKKQDEELTAAKKKIEAQNKKVAANREKKKTQSKVQNIETTSNSSDDNTSELIGLATKALSGKKNKGFSKGLILGIIIGLVGGIFVSSSFMGSISDKVGTTKDSVDKVIDETFLGYTAADFTEAILGEAVEKQDLLVMEQPLTIETTITKAGLGDLKIFSKVKNVSFAGKGIYTVNLQNINEEHISVDEERKIVTIVIPHAVLYEVVADFENTTFTDTDKGLLAFGDLSLTMEDQNELEKSVKETMTEELNKEELLEKADEIAKTKTWEIFNPLVEAISDEYIIMIEWE